MKTEIYYGKGGRLSKNANPHLINTAYVHDCNDSEELIEGLHIADIAHAIMLIEQEIIPIEEGRILLKSLIHISQTEIQIKPELGDVYNSKEYALKMQIGDISGWLHLGRARREAINNGFLLKYKSSVLKLNQTALNLSKVMLDISSENITTLMPDFTYMLHAQPTSLGHYLGTYITPLTRDLNRLDQFYDRLDLSWAGIGSVNGSRLPIDRHFLAKLLGFKKASPHIRDAMWMPDLFNEGMFILANILGGLNRFVQELIVWNTHEFGFLEIDDSYARASVIMPQKKNPYPLAYLRGLCNEITGKVGTYMMFGKEPSGFPDNRVFIYGDIIRTYEKVSAAINMFADFLQTVNWNKERMSNAVKKSFAYSTDLAEAISLNCKIDYKKSHTIVGKAVKKVGKENGNDILPLIVSILKDEEIIVSPSIIEELEISIDYNKLIDGRNGIGASSPSSMNEYISNTKDELVRYKNKNSERVNNFNQISSVINTYLKKILKNEFSTFKTTITV